MNAIIGQISIFDFIPKNSNLTREKCLHDESSPCNILNAHDVAKSIDIDCQYGCCNGCKFLNECGAACHYSTSHKPKYAKKTCAATLKECDCHCGTDSITSKCCSNCIEKCERRCEYSLGRYEVYDNQKKERVRNPDYFNYIWDLISHGTGFQNGKNRVKEYFKESHESKERIAFLKKEYGEGGFGMPHKGRKNFVHGSWSSAKGIRVGYLDADGADHEELIDWKQIEKEIAFLVGKEWY